MNGMVKMTRTIVALLIAAFTLSACVQTAPLIGADGKPARAAFRITSAEAAKIPFRVLDSVNAFRVASGVPPIELSAELTAAAATQARDMSLQGRPWSFGSDGSTPVERVARAGYTGGMLGENISETFEGDVETLTAWMQDEATRDVILNPDAKFMGIAWFQEPSGKLWWAQVFGS
jgi:uncharacterized protein YkwD